MTDIDRYLKLKDKAEASRREADRAAGALDQLRRRLKEACGTDDEARAAGLLKQGRREEAELKKEVEALTRDLLRDFPQLKE